MMICLCDISLTNLNYVIICSAQFLAHSFQAVVDSLKNIVTCKVNLICVKISGQCAHILMTIRR